MSARTGALTGVRAWGWQSLARGGVELKLFFREREAVLGTFGSPLLLLFLLAPIFSGQVTADATGPLTVAAGIATFGVGTAAFVSFGVGVATDRDDGTLARLRGVPAPAVVYLTGKAMLVLVTSLTTTALLLVSAWIGFGVRPPAQPGRWFTFGWVMLLGIAACALLGTVVSRFAASVRAAQAMMGLPFLAMSFCSGILVPISALPTTYQQIGAVFPLKWFGQGLRAALLPDELARFEAAGAWEHGRIALVLSAWCVGGLLLCLGTFRWRSSRDG